MGLSSKFAARKPAYRTCILWTQTLGIVRLGQALGIETSQVALAESASVSGRQHQVREGSEEQSALLPACVICAWLFRHQRVKISIIDDSKPGRHYCKHIRESRANNDVTHFVRIAGVDGLGESLVDSMK